MIAGVRSRPLPMGYNIIGFFFKSLSLIRSVIESSVRFMSESYFIVKIRNTFVFFIRSKKIFHVTA